MSSQMVESILAFLIRRWLSYAGLTALAVTDAQVGQLVEAILEASGAIAFIGNEVYQFWKMSRTQKAQGGVQKPV